MEFANSQMDDDRASPSHGSPAYHMKREAESLEDFEDITKDVSSSMKDVTAQFLDLERDKKSASSLNNPEYRSDDDFRSDDDVRSSEKSSSETFSNTTVTLDYPGQYQAPYNADKPIDTRTETLSYATEKSESDTDHNPAESVKDFLDFEVGQRQKGDGDDNGNGMLSGSESTATKDSLHEMERKGVDVANSYGEFTTHSDDMSFTLRESTDGPPVTILPDPSPKEIPNKAVLNTKDESDETPLKPPPTQTVPEPTPESTTTTTTTTMKSPLFQGDGLHVRKQPESDISDNEETVPEPIPRDYPEINDGREFFNIFKLGSWFHRNVLNPRLESLVYWRDPKKSGVVFGSVMVVLLSLTTFSLISVVAYTCLAVLTGTLSYRVYKTVMQAVQKTSEGHPFKKYLLPVLNHRAVTAVIGSIKEYLEFDVTLNPDKAREISDVVVAYVNSTLTKCRSLFLVEDIIDSVKFGFGLWCLTYVGSWFNGLSLLIICFVGLFTLPKVYENNKTQIDANLNVVRSKLNEVTEKLKAVSPVGKKSDESKDKGE